MGIIKRTIQQIKEGVLSDYYPKTSADQVAFTKTDGTESNIQKEVSTLNSTLSHVGMIIHTTKLDTMAKVKAIYGGTTWVKIEGRFLLGQGSGYGINSTGGETQHTLTLAEIPSHGHNSGQYLGFAGQSGSSSYSYNFQNYAAGQAKKVINWTNSGGGGAHNNMPPYKTVYIWERTA